MKQKRYSILLLLFAAAFLMIGITQKQPASVMTKAINICLECVGIG